jgi:hypothetical protein
MNNATSDEAALHKKPLFDQSRDKVARSTFLGVLLLAVSLSINFIAGTYASKEAGNAVRDIILDHVPVMDVDGIFVYGIIAFFIFVSVLLFLRPERAPFILKSLSIFIIIRSFFIILTHIGPAPQAILLASSHASIINYFTFTGDLFFSGHTGLPFLLALTFWRDRYLRVTFLVSSVMFGIVVLLGHLHYSIDLFAAFFITYGIFQIVVSLFNKDYRLLMSQYDETVK